jgi:hypothetical protein
MTKTLSSLILGAVVLGAPVLGSVAHAEQLANLERKVRLHATTELDQYKNPCVCNEPGEFAGAAGILRYAITLPVQGKRGIHVWCHAWRYDFSGAPDSSSVCDTFTVLAK